MTFTRIDWVAEHCQLLRSISAEFKDTQHLAGARPMGNSIESMDLGFALQARCLEPVANGSVDSSSCVVPVPGRIDAAIATSYLDRKYPAAPGA